MSICIRKQKILWILKFRENGWEAVVSTFSNDTVASKLPMVLCI
jgi:hypothetical protein